MSVWRLKECLPLREGLTKDTIQWYYRKCGIFWGVFPHTIGYLGLSCSDFLSFKKKSLSFLQYHLNESEGFTVHYYITCRYLFLCFGSVFYSFTFREWEEEKYTVYTHNVTHFHNYIFFMYI